jgi:hypothetical protein
MMNMKMTKKDREIMLAYRKYSGEGKNNFAVLSDGDTWFDYKIINNPDELMELNRKATDETDGNLYWVIINR